MPLGPAGRGDGRRRGDRAGAFNTWVEPRPTGQKRVVEEAVSDIGRAS